PDLALKSSLSAELFNSNFFYFSPSSVSGGINVTLPTTAQYRKEKFNDFSWLNENTATYSKSFGEHHFELLGGFTFQKFSRNGNRIQADTFADDRLPVVQGALNMNRGGTNDFVEEWSLVSFLSRLTYNYKGKYLLTASVRSDGSSRFGSENRWGTFPSVSAGWILSEEGFMQE